MKLCALTCWLTAVFPGTIFCRAEYVNMRRALRTCGGGGTPCVEQLIGCDGCAVYLRLSVNGKFVSRFVVRIYGCRCAGHKRPAQRASLSAGMRRRAERPVAGKK